MLPLKDNVPTERLPLLTLLLIAAAVALWLAVDGAALGQLAVSVLALWWFGPSVEDALARWRLAALVALGALAAAGLQALVDPGAGAAQVAAVGAVAAVVAAHLALYPRARIVALAFPLLFLALYELPAWLVAAAWAAAQVALTVAGVGALDGAASLAWLAALAVGAAAARPLAQRRQPLPGAGPTVPAVGR